MGRNGIAGQTKQWFAVQLPENQRFARSHRDLPEIERKAFRRKCALDEIVIADRGAAHRHYNIGVGDLCWNALERFDRVRNYAKIERHTAPGLNERGKSKASRSNDPARAMRLARPREFIASC